MVSVEAEAARYEPASKASHGRKPKEPLMHAYVPVEGQPDTISVIVAAPRRRFSWRIFAAILIPFLALSAGAVAYELVTSSGPPSATSVLQGDGYTVIPQSTLSDMGLALPPGILTDISSFGVGTKPGGRIEVVVVMTAAGQALIKPGAIAGLNTSGSGFTATENGRVLRLDGTENGG